MKTKETTDLIARLETIKEYWDTRGIVVNSEFIRGNIQGLSDAIAIAKGLDVWGSIESDRLQ